MKAVFLIDPIESLNPEKDTSLALISEAKNRNIECYYLKPNNIFLENKDVFFTVQKIHQLDLKKKDFFTLAESTETNHASTFSVLFIRLDPPFDEKYLNCTWMLDHVVHDLFMINSPSGIRNAQEKLSCLQFSTCIPETLVSSSLATFHDFLKTHKKCILKPLDQFGGTGIFSINRNDSNADVAFQQLTQGFKKPCIIQKFVSAASLGDKRILLLNGEPLGAVLRKNLNSDHRHNFFAGGKPFKCEITPSDLKIVEQIKSFLIENKLFFVGIDIIGDQLIEINVTSPTCLQEISNLNGKNLAEKVINFVLFKLAL